MNQELFYPYPSDFFSAERKKALLSLFSSNNAFWSRSGLQKLVIKNWLIDQVFIEAVEENMLINHSRNSNVTNQDRNTLQDLSDTSFRNEACKAWSNFHWDKIIPNIFLEKKSYLDKASLSMILVKEKQLAFELYFQLRANEKTFRQIYAAYSEPVDRANKGFYSLRPLKEYPYGLNQLIPRLKVNELTSPLKISDKFALIRLEDRQPATLDQDMHQLILKERFEDWINSTAIYALKEVCAV